MEFFTAHDVLTQQTEASIEDPVTVDLDTTIQDALTIMLENEFDQLPVLNDGYVEGTVTYRTVAKYIKSMDEPRIAETSVKIALQTEPEFVDRDRDLFELFETLAEDAYVLIGNREDLEGILTRYDVFYFLRDEVDPFLKIGEIENSLRELFYNSYDDLEDRIEETFADRAENDDSYTPPESPEEFSFKEYQIFMMRNLDQLPGQLQQDSEMVKHLLEDIRETRNALFHFRAQADEVDRDQLDMAHGYFRGFANTT